MRLHLELVGGIAGDMFSAAVLDLYPNLIPGCVEVITEVAGDYVEVSCNSFDDGTLTGRKFQVLLRYPHEKPHDEHEHKHKHHSNLGHTKHVSWGEIRLLIEEASITDTVRRHCIGVFTLLAEAEGVVHGRPIESVNFHEVGDWDSIVDILSAAYLIDALENIATDKLVWSSGAVPLGQGLVQSAHGIIPVPSPATLHLLRGYECYEDGRTGERVTPTGAAIFKYLNPSQSAHRRRSLVQSMGYGFGDKRFSGLSNILRITQFDDIAPSENPTEQDFVGKLSFEIDDQTAEDLAIGIDHIRSIPHVLDVIQLPAIGKKGRLVTSVQVLVQPSHRVDDVMRACFTQTTTLGIRWSIEQRQTLAREMVERESGDRIKIAKRPSGSTCKLESEDIRDKPGGYRARQHARFVNEQEFYESTHD